MIRRIKLLGVPVSGAAVLAVNAVSLPGVSGPADSAWQTPDSSVPPNNDSGWQ